MKCATYLRVSTTDQSVESQRLELTAFLKQRGMTLVQEFTDIMSGAKKDRPGLDSLMAAVGAGEIEAVVCVKLDRMGRSLAHFVAIAETLEKAGVALICTSQGIDTSKSNACGKFQVQVLMAVAAFERELIRERTRAGLAVAKANGKVLGRPSVLLPAAAEQQRIVLGWRASGGRDYRALGVALGGVSGSTAWRVAQRTPRIAEPVVVD